MNVIQTTLAQFGPVIANHLTSGTRGQDFGELFVGMSGQEHRG